MSATIRQLLLRKSNICNDCVMDINQWMSHKDSTRIKQSSYVQSGSRHRLNRQGGCVVAQISSWVMQHYHGQWTRTCPESQYVIGCKPQEKTRLSS